MAVPDAFWRCLAIAGTVRRGRVSAVVAWFHKPRVAGSTPAAAGSRGPSAYAGAYAYRAAGMRPDATACDGTRKIRVPGGVHGACGVCWWRPSSKDNCALWLSCKAGWAPRRGSSWLGCWLVAVVRSRRCLAGGGPCGCGRSCAVSYTFWAGRLTVGCGRPASPACSRLWGAPKLLCPLDDDRSCSLAIKVQVQLSAQRNPGVVPADGHASPVASRSRGRGRYHGYLCRHAQAGRLRNLARLLHASPSLPRYQEGRIMLSLTSAVM